MIRLSSACTAYEPDKLLGDAAPTARRLFTDYRGDTSHQQITQCGVIRAAAHEPYHAAIREFCDAAPDRA
jgi:hypothetical protein